MTGRPRAEAPSRYAQSIGATARWFDVALQTVHAWLQIEGCPQRTPEGYDLRAICRWQAQRDRRTATSADGRESMEEAELRKKRADADRSEMARDKDRRALIAVAEHKRQRYVLIEHFVSQVDSLPGRVAPLLVAAKGYGEIEDILQRHVRAIRIQLGAMFSPKPKEDEDDGDDSGESEAATS